MRKDPPFDMEYVYSTYLLELAERQGARVVNRPRACATTTKSSRSRVSISSPCRPWSPAWRARSAAFLDAQGDIVLKPLDGMGGASVFRLHRQDPNIGVVIETLTHYGRRTVMAQRYIPEIAKGDKRILLIDGKPAPYVAGAHPQARARRAATSPPARAASRSRCPPATARSREAVGPGAGGGRACCWSGWT